MSSGVDAVLPDDLPAEGLVEGVWQDEDGDINSAVADEDQFPELTARMSSARAAALLSLYADDRAPLLTAVMPDNGGVLRARWRTEPTPDDLDWSRSRRPRLRPGPRPRHR
ncbi:hypothetical protein ACIOKD_09750 [Streptomyces sp. NPDC087844]|uniref:hypothetical protein n=1 Tax=Streptomyces sp. NPDC087844 TaxID=3365805 RepID=UPI0037FEF2EA